MQLKSGTDVTKALSELEGRGFTNQRQNLRLLKRSGFDLEIVTNFLSSKKALLQLEDESLAVPLTKAIGKKNLDNYSAKNPELVAQFVKARKALNEKFKAALKEEVEDNEEVKNDDHQEECKVSKAERIAQKQEIIKSKIEKIAQRIIAIAQEQPNPSKQPKLTKEERLERLKSRAQHLAKRLSHLQEVASTLAEKETLNKEQREKKRAEKIARRQTIGLKNSSLTEEERLKLKAERKLARAQNGGFPAKLPERATKVFIDASTLNKDQNQVIEIAKMMLSNNPKIEKCMILYDSEVTPKVEERLVVASAVPLFESAAEAIRAMTSDVKVKKTLVVLTGNKPKLFAFREQGLHAFWSPPVDL